MTEYIHGSVYLYTSFVGRKNENKGGFFFFKMFNECVLSIEKYIMVFVF